MAGIDIDRLGNNSRIWIFGISPALDAEQGEVLLQRVDSFLEKWAAHGVPIVASRQLLEGSFLVVAVDQRSETSGCSIDSMFGLLKEMERQFGATILDSSRIFVRHGDGRVDALSRADFRARGDAHTKVFDTNAEHLGEIRSGSWERRASESWHKALLG